MSGLLQNAAALISQLLKADLSGMAELVDDGSAVALSVSTINDPAGSASKFNHTMPTHPTDSMAGYTLTRGEPVTTADLSEEDRFRDDFLHRLGVISALAVPLRVAGRPTGVVGIYRRRREEFVPDDVRTAEAIIELLSSLVTRIKVEEASRCSDEEQSTNRQEADLPAEQSADRRESFRNRRTNSRRPYEHWQLMAPITSGVLPARHQFLPVECADISTGGISFYVDSRPLFDTVVVALGNPFDLTYFTARVVRISPQERDGHPVFLLGCQFLGRVHL